MMGNFYGAAEMGILPPDGTWYIHGQSQASGASKDPAGTTY